LIPLGALRDVLDPFCHPRSMSRKPATGERGTWPEFDVVTVQVTAGDLMRLQVLHGTLSVDLLRTLPTSQRPGVELLMELERLEELLERARKLVEP
jgi:hypothetical protein